MKIGYKFIAQTLSNSLIMKNRCCFLSMYLLVGGSLIAQVSINSDNSAPDNSAMLDVKSTSKGFLLPRVTVSQMGAITNPANGLIVFCTTDNKYYGYISQTNTWKEILFGPGAITPGTCGFLTINHVAGNVAPVTKTVTYSTVTNIPGEPAKCWITSNLGADHQANAVDDATEASAGWYWQFNLKQGYKHDGTTRTPNTTWISSIDENSDWIPANDPCTIEFGTDWRIPTYFEWFNVINSGNWQNWNGPWNSGLKLHSAGRLGNISGSLDYRGIIGNYRSNTQSSNSDGWLLFFSSYSSNMSGGWSKTNGLSLRCLRN